LHDGSGAKICHGGLTPGSKCGSGPFNGIAGVV
jgi:hypothetical protein